MKNIILFCIVWLNHTMILADNIDLSTLPPRNSIQLTIYNPEDLTLVRETRTLYINKGITDLQFSWANTLIDPSSVHLRFLSHADQIEVLDTIFPQDKPYMLYWEIASEMHLTLEIEISYFTSGIHWQADYLAIVNQTEKEVSLESFIKVTNNSGEDYPNAEVRLIVGQVNLVEDIKNIGTTMPTSTVGKMQIFTRDGDEMRKNEMDDSFDHPFAAPSAGFIQEQPKEVQKESFSEYFLYTIEGKENIPNGWAKRLLSFRAKNIPLEIVYRYRPEEYGDYLARLYIIKNNQESHLGNTALPDGNIRILQKNTRNSLIYIGENSTAYIPIGDKMELNLGADPHIEFNLIKTKINHTNFLLKLKNIDVYRKADKYFRFEKHTTVAGWDEYRLYQQEINNFTNKPITVEMRRSFVGDIEFTSAFKPKFYDYKTLEFSTKVEAGERKKLPFAVIEHKGKNYEKDRIKLIYKKL